MRASASAGTCGTCRSTSARRRGLIERRSRPLESSVIAEESHLRTRRIGNRSVRGAVKGRAGGFAEPHNAHPAFNRFHSCWNAGTKLSSATAGPPRQVPVSKSPRNDCHSEAVLLALLPASRADRP
jgi:hypothetical protein